MSVFNKSFEKFASYLKYEKNYSEDTLKNYISDLAAVGIYYFRKAEVLKSLLNKLVAKELSAGEEYQINHGIL